MKWLTWQDVAVDRIGCAWLIRKFIDPGAEFIFAPEGSTKTGAGIAEGLGAWRQGDRAPAREHGHVAGAGHESGATVHHTDVHFVERHRL